MAKVQLIAGRRVATSEKTKPSTKPAIDKSRKAPEPRVRDKLSGLSLRQLLKATPPYIKSNAEEVVIKSLREATTKGGLPGIRSKTISVGKKTRDVYDTTIVGKEVGIPISKQKHVLVSCSCGWFWSHCEYALAHWGSAVIKYSNGEPATITNPGNHPLLCKHLVKLASTVVREGM